MKKVLIAIAVIIAAVVAYYMLSNNYAFKKWYTNITSAVTGDDWCTERKNAFGEVFTPVRVNGVCLIRSTDKYGETTIAHPLFWKISEYAFAGDGEDVLNVTFVRHGNELKFDFRFISLKLGLPFNILCYVAPNRSYFVGEARRGVPEEQMPQWLAIFENLASLEQPYFDTAPFLGENDRPCGEIDYRMQFNADNRKLIQDMVSVWKHSRNALRTI